MPNENQIKFKVESKTVEKPIIPVKPENNENESGSTEDSGSEGEAVAAGADLETITVYNYFITGMTQGMQYKINDNSWMEVTGADGNSIELKGFTLSDDSIIRIVNKGDGINSCDSDFLVIKFNNPGHTAQFTTEKNTPQNPVEPSVIAAARAELEKARLELDTILKDNETALKLAQTNIDSCKTELDRLQTAGGTFKMAYDVANKTFIEADDAFKEADKILKDKISSEEKNAQLSSIDLSDIGYQIEQQKKKIKELSGGEDNEITAKVSGTIQTVDCTSGDTKVKDDLLCTIEVPDMGYTMSFSVTNDQARRLRPGDTATVSNFYWGNEIKATLSSIKVDPKNPQTNKLLSFDLEGDVNAGSELTLSVGQKSANYDVIIPNSSIRNDTNGSFVLKIEAKNSPLGNRYIARRVSVEVLAADDVNSAVTGDLGYGDYVITTSNAPVKTGDQVRMADS